MSETTITYEASVYKRVVKYTNFNGKTQETELFFALDPLQLLRVIAGFQPKKSKSNNPAKKDALEISEAEQVEFVQDIAAKAAGFPSDDGETWEPFEDFLNTLAGKAFLTSMVSSDSGRREFAEKVLLDPFRAFVGFASADTSNTKEEIDQFHKMLAQLENIFAAPDPKNESLEERRARLRAEMEALDESTEGPDA